MRQAYNKKKGNSWKNRIAQPGKYQTTCRRKKYKWNGNSKRGHHKKKTKMKEKIRKECLGKTRKLEIKLCNRDIGPAVRVFANGPGDLGSIPGRVIPKTLKMELDTTLLNTQHYKVRFKGKVEQSWEWSSALPYTLV